MRPAFALLAALAVALPALAQQQPPPPKAYIPAPDEQQQLDEAARTLEAKLSSLPTADRPDAEVFLKIKRISDQLRLYTQKRQVADVLRGLELGRQRCELLAKGEKPWQISPGRSLRGFRSQVDGSIQPYGVVLPSGYDPKSGKLWRLEVFLHGRGTTEVSFLQQQEPASSKAPDQDLIELHPFGRANNGWRWSGETDAFEALDQVKRLYRIDPNRIQLRGFSMGGHGAWHIGIHHPDQWCAVSPGAGFTDTRKYLKLTKPEPALREMGWHIYDAVDYAANLWDAPFIGYGGEKDPQLQATLNMQEVAEKEGAPLKMVIGPNTEHRYHPDSLKEILAYLADHTRNPSPAKIKFTTWTLKYNQCAWLTLDALDEHYRRALVDAAVTGPKVVLKTESVAGLTLHPMPAGVSEVEIDGQSIRPKTLDGVSLDRRAGKWSIRPARAPNELAKRHGLQGPIDDAFTRSFVAVGGTGSPWNPKVQAYADSELKRFQEEWLFGFRGEVPLKDDTAVTDADIRASNLILFGDPGSNAVLAKIAARLPIRWTRDGVAIGKALHSDASPVLVFPNPLNPQRYVVINSGHTFNRKDLDASNAFLYPKLADWALIDLSGAAPKVAEEGYFDEHWRLKP